MTTTGKGFRSGTRKTFRKAKRSKFTVEKFMREFSDGQRVVVKQDPSSQKGMPHRRYRGKIGLVEGKRGSSYVVDLKLGGKRKQVISKPEHLRPHKQ